MSDDQAAEHPLANLAAAEQAIDPPVHEPELVEKVDAAARLRAFEDKHFGTQAVRINDRIERGMGSPYQMAAPEVRKQHKAIENLIEAEAKLAAAHSALIAADAEYEAAEKACDAAPE